MSESDYYIVWIPGPPAGSQANVRAEASLAHRYIPDGQNTARVFEVGGVAHGVVEVEPGGEVPSAPLQVVAGPMTADQTRQWIISNADDGGNGGKV